MGPTRLTPGMCRAQSSSHPTHSPGDEDQPVVFAPQLCFQKRGFPLLRLAGTQEKCTTAAHPPAPSSWVTGAFPGSHHTRLFARCFHTKPLLVGKGNAAHPAAAEAALYRDPLSRAEPSPPAGWEPLGPRDVLMLPWAGESKGLEVSPVPAAPGDGARGALLSGEWWESSTLPQGTWPDPTAAAVVGGRAITSTSGQSKPLPASSALPVGTRQGPFCPCCSTQQLLCFIPRFFSVSHMAGRAKVSSWCPGAQTPNEKL